jgi:hypothetical protein
MKKVLTVFLSVFLGFSIFLTGCQSNGLNGQVNRKYTSEQIYAMAEKSVGEITTYNQRGDGEALGSCFAISQDGRFVTNYHVIDGAYSAEIAVNGTTYDVSSVLAYDKDLDLAVLKVNGRGFSSVVIEKKNINGGETVYAVGSSEGYTLSFSTGVIASPDRVIDGVHYIQHEAAISHGNSGGPLYNEYGKVIGINTMTNIEGQNLNFAVACSELDKLSYGQTLTLAEFYEKECDVFTRMANYTITYGERDTDSYTYQIGYDYTSDYSTKFTRALSYYPNDEEIMISLLSDDGYMFCFIITQELTGRYSYLYLDEDDYYMIGTIYGSLFDYNYTLTYTDCNVSYVSLRNTIKELASTMANYLLVNLEEDLSSIGVTAYDLGFVNY